MIVSFIFLWLVLFEIFCIKAHAHTLADGDFIINVRLAHANNINNDSMSNAALDKTGYLHIEDGKISIVLKFNYLSLYDVNGNEIRARLATLSYFNDEMYTPEWDSDNTYITNATSYTGDPILSEVLSYQIDNDTKSWIYESGYDNKLPEKLTFELPSYAVNETGKGYVLCRLFAPAMGAGGYQHAFVEIDFSSMSAYSGNTIEEAKSEQASYEKIVSDALSENNNKNDNADSDKNDSTNNNADTNTDSSPSNNDGTGSENDENKTGNIISYENANYKIITPASESSLGSVAFEGVIKNKKRIVIPESISVNNNIYMVTRVSKNAFLNNKKLREITIANNINKIGKNAFKGCINLKWINFYGKSAPSFGKNVFKKCKSIKTITLINQGNKKYKKVKNKFIKALQTSNIKKSKIKKIKIKKHDEVKGKLVTK